MVDLFCWMFWCGLLLGVSFRLYWQRNWQHLPNDVLCITDVEFCCQYSTWNHLWHFNVRGTLVWRNHYLVTYIFSLYFYDGCLLVSYLHTIFCLFVAELCVFIFSRLLIRFAFLGIFSREWRVSQSSHNCRWWTNNKMYPYEYVNSVVSH